MKRQNSVFSCFYFDEGISITVADITDILYVSSSYPSRRKSVSDFFKVRP